MGVQHGSAADVGARQVPIETNLQELALRSSQAKARAGIEFFEPGAEERK